ncbi:serine/threonine protein kinase [Entomoplasma ellychniae]|uniref:non-specific serine/threonine protein kinase n=1 Tax=Entomoplasma ellychniae TaxID=2114 RepID=A0A8E2QYN4_9MOLU|nr:serine/threonine-protein kinase [Entomoplasma ellychniae]PPE05015.1 serine/threonine protein kinase [Entomoplasma ellychniae]
MRSPIEIEKITRVDELEENEFVNLKVSNRYILMDQIGKGTFGVVYKAKDLLDSKTSKNEFVAIKIMVLPKSKTEKNKIIESEIKDEIKKYSNQIFNSRVVNIKDSFEWNKLLFIVMEYVDGKSFKDLIKETSSILTYEEIIYYFSEIALAIQGMHDMKMIHRDLKPDNILLTSNNKIKITDFGISHIKGFVSEDGNLQKTKKPSSPGTPRYSSPEQILDATKLEDLSSYQADIYSFGVMMYETATGTSIIKAHDQSFSLSKEKGKSIQDFFLNQTLIKKFILPSHINPKISNSLENIIMKCLEKNPEDRYGTATEVYNDLMKLEKKEKVEKNYKQNTLKSEDKIYKNPENEVFISFNKKFFKKIVLPAVVIIIFMFTFLLVINLL